MRNRSFHESVQRSGTAEAGASALSQRPGKGPSATGTRSAKPRTCSTG